MKGGLDNIQTWSQGYFVDQIKYSNWSQEDKSKVNYQESFLVRPSPTGNAICKCTCPDDAEWIARKLNLAYNLKALRAVQDERVKKLEFILDELIANCENIDDNLYGVIEEAKKVLQGE